MESAGQWYITYPKRSDEIKIYMHSDWHLGAKAVARDRLERDLRRIERDPYSFLFGGGDLIDAISPNDKRWDADEIDKEIVVKETKNIGKKQMDMVYKYLNPLRHKIIGLGYGNHEDKYMHLNNNSSLHQDLCDRLGVVNLHYCAFFDTIFCRGGKLGLSRKPPPHGGDRWLVRHFFHHGAGGGSAPGSKLGRIMKFGREFECHIAWMGHLHDQVGKRTPIIGADGRCRTVTHKDRMDIISGSYLRTYMQGSTGYGEKKGYSPAPLGASYVIFNPEEREYRGVI